MKLKNINRGLVLAAILIVGTAGYEVYSNIKFKEAKPKLENLTKEFSADIAKACVGEATEVKKNWKTILDKYFTVADQSVTDFGFTKSNYSEVINNITKDNPYGKVTSAAVNLKNLKISKYGSGATANFNVDYYYEIEGSNIQVPMFCPTCKLNSTCDDNGNVNVEEAEKNKNKKQSLNQSEENVKITFAKEGSNWKIVSIQGFGGDDTGELNELKNGESADDNDTDSKAEKTEQTKQSEQTTAAAATDAKKEGE